MEKELKSGWYNKNLKEIDPNNEDIGTILYVTKDFSYLKDFVTKFKNSNKKAPCDTNDLIIDVSNSWIDITIKVYAKVNWKKQHITSGTKREIFDYLHAMKNVFWYLLKESQ